MNLEVFLMAALSLMLSTLTLLRLVYNGFQSKKQVEKRLVTVNPKVGISAVA